MKFINFSCSETTPTPPFFKSGCQENYQFFTDFVGRVKISFDITLSDSNTGVVASINRGR